MRQRFIFSSISGEAMRAMRPDFRIQRDVCVAVRPERQLLRQPLLTLASKASYTGNVI